MNRTLASTRSDRRDFREGWGLGVPAGQGQGLLCTGSFAGTYTCAQAGYFGWQQLTTR